MQFHCLKPSDMTGDLWDAYAALRVQDSCKEDPFFDPQFARFVSEVRPDVRILMAEEAGEPVAFWAIHKRSGGWARPIGGPFSDWHAPIRKLGIDLSPQQILAACGLTGLTAQGMQPCHHGPVPDGLERVAANITDLSMGYDVFLEDQRRQFPKHFKKMRRMQRNLERDFTDVVYTFDDRCPDAFEWLMTRKREQYTRTNKHDVLATDWSHKLLDRLRHERTGELGVYLTTLRFDGRIAAAELNIHSARVLHGWIVAFDTEFSYYSPGYLVQHNVLQMMPEHGLVVYDAGPDLDYYKKYYANIALPLDRGVLRSGKAVAAPERMLGASWRAAEQVMPEKVSGMMGRLRRRTDQIVSSEMSLSDQAGGLVKAFTHKGG